MSKVKNSYSHLLEIDEKNRRLVINRVYQDGTQQLFTFVDLPSKSFSEDEKGFRYFAQMLGENLLVDSPEARKLLGL